MASKLKIVALRQALAPGLPQLFLSVTPNDNVYVTGGVQLDLSAGNILDPNGVAPAIPTGTTAVLPGIFSESLGGYYAAVVPPTATGTLGLKTYKFQYFTPGGAEIAAGAYPVAITTGTLVLQIV